MDMSLGVNNFWLDQLNWWKLRMAEWWGRRPIDAACICTKRKHAQGFRNHLKEEITSFFRTLLTTIIVKILQIETV